MYIHVQTHTYEHAIFKVRTTQKNSIAIQSMVRKQEKEITFTSCIITKITVERGTKQVIV